MGQIRETLKGFAPLPAVNSVRWSRDVWGDLQFRLLSEIGFFPSHHVRKAVYRRAGMKLDETSSIHWRAEFHAPGCKEIGPYCTTGDSAFLDG
ncbi:hypothetical protein [Propionibacterium sp.]|uniref:hypothetical protein n=1 Tax=Propionibacterium sp. TaxID=1977903 RepID=UPI0039ED698D